MSVPLIPASSSARHAESASRSIVFGGPSLSPEARQAALSAGLEVHEPARRGDIARIMQIVRLVVLLDGYFDWTLSVAHTELRVALDAGVTVIGASSLGALRASELQSAGMIGVGWVYERFTEGLLWEDDEVALLHAPAELDYEALTIPLVNLRMTVDALVNLGVMSDSERRLTINRLKCISYKRRTWNCIRETLFEADSPRSGLLVGLLRSHYIDQKRLDGLTAITLAAGLQAEVSDGGQSNLQPSVRPVGVACSSTADGIARYCGLSGLDDIPWPVVAAVRENFIANPIALGSGYTTVVAKANALAESIEFSALELPPADDNVTASYAAIRGNLGVVEPWRLPGFRPSRFMETEPLVWVQCVDILSGNSALVPHAAIGFAEANPYWFSTNGMAASHCMRQSVVHALLEIAERHIVSMFAIDRNGQLNAGSLRLLDPTPRMSGEFLSWIKRKRGGVFPLRIDNPSDLHCFMTFLVTREDALERITIGYGCSEDEADAFDKSLKEAIQVRMAYINGARPGLDDRHFSRGNNIVCDWLDGMRPAATIPVVTCRASVQERERTVLHELETLGERELFQYSFGPTGDWHVVKILAPRLHFDHRAF